MTSYVVLSLFLVFLTGLGFFLHRGWQRRIVEPLAVGLLFLCAAIAVLTTVGIVFSVLWEALAFFQKVSPLEFFFSTHWSPQTAVRGDQIAAEGSFGMLPVMLGTLLITLIAILIAGPVGFMAAVYLSEYAPVRVRKVFKPILEILAGVPTVVYGFFAALTVGPLVQQLGLFLGLEASSASALAAGLVMGIMIIPLVSSLSEDAIHAVPYSLREGALGLGATSREMVLGVVVPAALPGIVGAFLIATSKAIGETMIVVMAAGLAANLTINPFESVTTVTAQIVNLLGGDQQFDSAKTLAAFALGLMLFVVTLVLNIVALECVRRFREQSE